MATKITIAHSPDSDDAFMFYGFACGAVDTEGLEIAQVLADIETLNRAAVTGTYEVTAASFHAFAHLRTIALLRMAPAWATLRAHVRVRRRADDVDGVTVALPGCGPRLAGDCISISPAKYVVLPFDEILAAVREQVEAGR